VSSYHGPLSGYANLLDTQNQTFQGPVTFDAQVTAAAPVTFDAQVTAAAPATFNGLVTASDVNIRHLQGANGALAGSNISITLGTAFQVDTNTDRYVMIATTLTPTATVDASVDIQLSYDGTNFNPVGSVLVPSGISAAFYFPVFLYVPKGWYVKVLNTSGTGATAAASYSYW
jgi:hypothetical protein